MQHRFVATSREEHHLGTGQKKRLLVWITSPVSPYASILQEGGYWQKRNGTADLSS